MDSLFNFSGRKIMVTGAASGIGRETAILLNKLGAELVLCDKDEYNLKQTACSFTREKDFKCIALDLLSFESYDKFFSHAVSDGNKLDGLVHCAGIVKVTPLKALCSQQINAIMDINFTSFIMLCANYSKRKYSDGGSIVGVSAVNAHVPQKCMSVYAASKAAVEAGVKTMSLELARKNIRVNCVAPGAVDTAMARDSDEETLKKITSGQLLGIELPEQVANVIAFLLSDASAVITGRTVFADGGMLGQLSE